ncbi:hypothetical protein [Streptomyces sp. NBC_01136]|uniref:hypothetical protein n=1 Tax=Streptomyces sp. NBC_01136 TaxID=2903754 RepID=UPI0038688F9F
MPLCRLEYLVALARERHFARAAAACSVSGSSLSARARHAAGTREIPESWPDGAPIRDECLIVDAGAPAGTGARSYSVSVTGWSSG